MRLLNTCTGKFEEFQDESKIPRYAILSHTWNPKGEQIYQEVRKVQEAYEILKQGVTSAPISHSAPLPATQEDALPEPITSDDVASVSSLEIFSEGDRGSSEGRSTLALVWVLLTFQIDSSIFPQVLEAADGPGGLHIALVPTTAIWDHEHGLCRKIQKACEVARSEGYEYIWIDSSCINKESSSELSEAINSMYKWYGRADVCFVFLADVPDDDDVYAVDSAFRRSRWFRRGWTLQELIAPRRVLFFSSGWTFLGTKFSLVDVIQDVTQIDGDILLHNKSLNEASVAQRMSWASTRETTRIEDQAYSLLGIFAINMPTLYGEGEQAFRRLQEEILKRIPDQSLFAWGDLLPYQSSWAHPIKIDTRHFSLLAPSPRMFHGSSEVVAASDRMKRVFKIPPLEFTQTPYGIRTQVCLVSLKHTSLSSDVSRNSPPSGWFLVVLGCEHSAQRGKLLGKICYLPPTETSVQLLYAPDVTFSSGSLSRSDIHPTLFFALSPSDVGSPTLPQLLSTNVHLPYIEHADSLPQRYRDAETTISLTSSESQVIQILHGLSNPRMRFSSLLSDLVQHQVNPNTATTAGCYLILPTSIRAVLQGCGFTATSSQVPWHAEPDRASWSFTLTGGSITIHIRFKCRTPQASTLSKCLLGAHIWLFESPSNDRHGVGWTDSEPPYTSTTWYETRGRPTNLPRRVLPLQLKSGDVIGLELGLETVAGLRYHVHIAIVAGTAVSHIATTTSVNRYRLYWPQEAVGLRLFLLGSVEEALEARGWIAYLEGPRTPTPNSTYTLTMGNGKSTVIVTYRQQVCSNVEGEMVLNLVAEITLEEFSPGNTSEGYQDGPCVLTWSDACDENMGWRWALDEQQVTLTTPSGSPLALRLGADLMWPSEYSLRVDVLQEGNDPRLPSLPRAKQDQLYAPHRTLKLVLPGHIKCMLQLRGYDVQWRVQGEEARSSYCLTLSRSNLTISIQYSQSLGFTMRADASEEKLTLRADVKCTLVRRRGNKEIVHTLDWEVKQPWKPELPMKQVTLSLATGCEVVVRLGFYLLWYSEYCLVVEASDVFEASNVAPSSSWIVATYRRLAETSRTRLKLGKKREQTDAAVTGPSDE